LASEIAANKGEVMQNLNKTLRFAKQNAQVALKMTPHVNDLQDGVLVAFVDAAFGVRHDHASQGGFTIVHTHKDILTGAKRKYSVISWKSFKLQRVVRSSLGAEAQAMATYYSGGALLHQVVPQDDAEPHDDHQGVPRAIEGGQMCNRDRLQGSL